MRHKFRTVVLAAFAIAAMFQVTALANGSSVYYDSGAQPSGDGSEASPVNNLEDALDLAGEDGTIVVMSYIPIEKDTLLENVTFLRGIGYDEDIFQVSGYSADTKLVLNNVTIDGNKENISMGEDKGSLIYIVGGSAVVEINDGTKICNNDTTAIKISPGSTVIMNGGEISDNTGYGAYAGVVHVHHEGTFILNNGTIKNNEAELQGGISIEAASGTTLEEMAKFYMNGGLVENNRATDGCGGGILNYGYAELTGGEIKGNKASWGAGIACVGNSKTILDGTLITGNECSGNGAGVYVEGFTNINGDSCVFEMKSGEITENVTTNGNGGGIFAYYWTNSAVVKISGGEISGNSCIDDWGAAIALNGEEGGSAPELQLSGDPEISGSVLLRDDRISDAVIEVTGEFSPKEPVTIVTQTGKVESSLVKYSNGVTPNAGSFKYGNDESYDFVVKDNTLILAMALDISVTIQPKLSYTSGDRLDLSDLEITVGYGDGIENIKLSADNENITFKVDGKTIEDGDKLKTDYDGKTITVEYKGLTAETGKLSIKEKSKSSSGSSYSLEEGRTKKDNEKDDEPVATPEKNGPFYDVSTNDPSYDAIINVYEKGWMEGVGEGVFAPNGTLTRGMAAQILWNMAGNPEPAQTAPFLDVTADAWYYRAVAWAYEQGIVLGYDKITFGPNDYVTTEQFTIMLEKSKGNIPAPYVGGAPNATRGWVAAEISR